MNFPAVYLQRLEAIGVSRFNWNVKDIKPAIVVSGTCPSFWFPCLSALIYNGKVFVQTVIF